MIKTLLNSTWFWIIVIFTTVATGVLLHSIPLIIVGCSIGALILIISLFYGIMDDIRFNNREKMYTIRKGKHSSGIHLSLFFKKPMSKRFKVVFDENCLVAVGGQDYYDINKLFGFAFGRHHRNSLRVGWRTTGELIDLYYYGYKKGVRESFEIKTGIIPGKEYDIDIDYIIDSYRISVTDDEGMRVISYVEFKVPFFLLGYKLFPYFGGNQPAPVTMKIKIKHDK